MSSLMESRIYTRVSAGSCLRASQNVATWTLPVTTLETGAVEYLAAPQGFEPRYADPESAVLPLNEGATVVSVGAQVAF